MGSSASARATRHYVLKTPLDYHAAREAYPNAKRAAFATGCFWGSEKSFWRLPKGIISTAVGYCGGPKSTTAPNYESICSSRTGYAEAVQVIYNPEQISYADLLRLFWESHDPTQGNGQGNDRGSQYRSGIYYEDEDQKKLAECSKCSYQQALNAAGKGKGRSITTEIKSLHNFYLAEDYHQQYLARPGSRQYCSAEPQGVSLPGFNDWAPQDLQQHSPKLPQEYWQRHAPKEGCVLFCSNEPITFP